MGTIAKKLQTALASKEAIKAALIAKGVENVDDVMSHYAGFIEAIQSGGGGDLDFTKIGYEGAPQYLIDGLAYAEKIKREWDENAPVRHDMFSDDKNIVFFPSLKSNATGELDKSFQMPNALVIGDLIFPNVTSTHQTLSGMPGLIAMGKILFPKSIYCKEIMTNKVSLEKIEFLDVSMGTLTATFSFCDKLRYMEIKFGYAQDFGGITVTKCPLWGVNNDKYPNAEEVMKRSLLINSCDRAKAGYPSAPISLAPQTKALLTQDEIAQITAKGYTLS